MKPIRTKLGLYTEEDIEQRDITVTFACGDSYQGTARYYWQRWRNDDGRIVREQKRVDIEIPGGVANGDDVAFGNDPERIYEWSSVMGSIEAAVRYIVKQIDSERHEYGYRCPDILAQYQEGQE
jgi:hypothetical protein